MKFKIMLSFLVLLVFIVGCGKGNGMDPVTGNGVAPPMEDAEFNIRLDECYNQYGLSRSECLQHLAFDSEKPVLCEGALTYKNHCYVFLADKLKDPEMCELSGKMREICLHALKN